jgi:sugar lactone lactonase YvrE
MMKQLRGGFGIGALVWLRGALFVLAACVAVQAAMAQSVRLVPSTSRFAGDGTGNPTSDGPGVATTIPLTAPTYVTSDSSGNIYIADTGNNCIRRVDTTGTLSIVAGQPTAGSDTCQNASSVTAADFTTGVLRPSGVALDAAGNLFVADPGHNCVRRLVSGAVGIASLQPLVGNCTDPSTTSVAPAPAGLALDAAGNLYIAIDDAADNIYQVLRSSPSNYAAVCLLSGAPSTAVPAGAQCLATTNGVVLNAPLGLTFDPVGNLYIADSGNACVREISAGIPSIAVGTCANGGTGAIATALQAPVSVTSDAVGHLYIDDNAAAKIYEILANQLALIAGNGGANPYTATQDGHAAVSVALLNPQGLAADKTGNVYVADTNNNIIRILTQGLGFPETLVGNLSTPQNLWFIMTDAVNLASAPSGDFKTLAVNTCNGGVPAPPPGQFNTCQVSLRLQPTLPGLRTAPFTISDSATSPVGIYRFGLSGVGQSAEAIFMPGTIKTLSGSLATPSAIAIDSAGDVYFAESGGGSGHGSISVLLAGSSSPVQLIAPAGGVATPTALALDATGNLYIADAATNSIFRYDVNGILTPFVSGLDNPVALVADQLGNLYVAQDGTTVNVLQIYAGGQRAVFAGGGANTAPNNVPATSAKFVHPSALYLNPAGTLYVADRGAFRVYSIDVSGTIRYFAGNGTSTDTISGKKLGTGLAGIAGISADAGGDLYIADATTNRIFVAFHGLAHNPEITVLSGDGTAAYTGDGGPADKAELNNPMAVAVDGAADVYIADTGNSALREITYTYPTLDFGTVKIGQTGGPLHTTLWNAGNGVLNPLSAILDDTVNFAVDPSDTNCGNSIPAGATCDFSFFFTPQAQGSYVAHDNLNDSSVVQPQIITLIGNAPPLPVTTFNAPAVTVVYGNAYTLAATLGGNQTSGPTGTVTFLIGGSTLCAAQALPASGAVSCSPLATLEDVGTYTVTVSYSGDSNYPAANSTITLTVTPRPVTITADNKTRAVNTPNPTLTGTVVNVVPGQSITATYSTAATISSPAGTYPIVPAYTVGAGTKASNYAITLVNGTLTITASGSGGGNPPPGGGGGNPPPGGGGGGTPPPGGGSGGNFTLAMNPPEQEVDHNGTVNYSLTLTSTSGFTGPVTLACSGLPEGASCAFAPASVALTSGATGTSIMTITAAADTTNVPTVFGKMRTAPPAPPAGDSPLLAWTMVPLGLFGSAGGLLAGVRRRRRLLLLLVPFALLAAAVGMSGCAGPNNYKIYTVTVTGSAASSGATITQSSTVDFVLAR